MSKIVLQTALLDVRSFQQAVAFLLWVHIVLCGNADPTYYPVYHFVKVINRYRATPDCISSGSFAGSRCEAKEESISIVEAQTIESMAKELCEDLGNERRREYRSC